MTEPAFVELLESAWHEQDRASLSCFNASPARLLRVR